MAATELTLASRLEARDAAELPAESPAEVAEARREEARDSAEEMTEDTESWAVTEAAAAMAMRRFLSCMMIERE